MEVQKILKEYCGKRIAVSDYDLKILQQKKLLLGESQEEVDTIWKEICDRCPLVDNFGLSESQKSSEHEKFVFDEKLQHNTTPTTDICVAYAMNGYHIATYNLHVQ